MSDYLFLLRASAEALSPFGSYAMFYLAAAVSDFYIPENEMVSKSLATSISCLQAMAKLLIAISINGCKKTCEFVCFVKLNVSDLPT